MDHIHHVEVRADRSIVPGSLVWRYGGRLHVTAVAKATFALGIDAPMALIAPEALFEDDRVPFRPRADVVVRASARSGRAARIIVQGADGMLQKAVEHAGALGPRAAVGLRSTDRLLELPDDCDFDLFQRAPADQQLRHLHGDEWIVLEGLHPSLDRVTTRIPGARATGRAAGLGAAGAVAPFHLEADALFVDADELRCTITWRAVLPVADLDHLAQLRIELELEIAGQAVRSRRSVDLEGTLDLSAHAASRAALPFDRSAQPALPASLPAAPPSSARHPFEGTLDLTGLAATPGATPPWLRPRPAPPSTPLLGETTLTMDDSVAARSLQAPFPLAAAAAPPPSSKPISGAPWSAEPAPRAPTPSADFASTLDLTSSAAKGGAAPSPQVTTTAASDARPRLFRKLPPKKT